MTSTLGQQCVDAAKIRSLLSDEQIEERKSFIGGSDARKIMQGNWHDLWLQKTGRAIADSLETVFVVQLGNLTEKLNRAFLYIEHDIATMLPPRVDAYRHPLFPFMACNPDAFSADGQIVVDFKHTNAWNKPDKLLSTYFWQMQHNMFCTGTTRGMISPIYGNNMGEPIYVEQDLAQLELLQEAEAKFWKHVVDDKEPVDTAEVTGQFDPITTVLPAMRMRGTNKESEWSEAAEKFLANKEGRTKANDAEKDLKVLMPDDHRLAYGFGVIINRAKNGNLSLKKLSIQAVVREKLESGEDELV